MDTETQAAIEDWISKNIDPAYCMDVVRPVSGGCINDAFLAGSQRALYFIKLNAPSKLEAFAAERKGLIALERTGAVRVPRPLACLTLSGHSLLILEALDLAGPQAGSWARMGRALARMHRSQASEHGWGSDNFIGASPQFNKPTSSWTEFFREQRLRPQLEMCRRRGMRSPHAEAALQRVGEWLHGHDPAPSLLHGDLWSGNAGFLKSGEPILYDPACYYGDRETDLAFSEFFGGFPPAFYQAYAAEWPLAEGYMRRKPVYNLYHILNHANLFGGGYWAEAERSLETLAAGPV